MATKRHTLKGKAYWSKVFDSNKEMKDYLGEPYDFGGLFKIDILVDKENKAIYKTSGSAGKGKFDDDGNFIVTLKRKERVVNNTTGQVMDWASGPPKVVNKDGSDFEGTIIPNGSIVEADFTVYTTSKSPGTRLEKITVLELASLPDREEDNISAAKTEVKTNNTIDTEVPF